MKPRKSLAVLAALAAAIGMPASAAEPAGTAPATNSKSSAAHGDWKDRVYFGGSMGLSFGDVDYVTLRPEAGYAFTPKWSSGLALSYVHRSDSRVRPEFTTNDFGFDLFNRYRFVPQAFGEVRYSHWSYEVPLSLGGTVRESYSGYLAGGGFVQPLGGRAVFIASALYDFNYSTNNRGNPYDSPWVISAGVSVGF